MFYSCGERKVCCADPRINLHLNVRPIRAAVLLAVAFTLDIIFSTAIRSAAMRSKSRAYVACEEGTGTVETLSRMQRYIQELRAKMS